MGCHFPGLSGIDPFVIDQDVTVDFGHGHSRDWGDMITETEGVIATNRIWHTPSRPSRLIVN
jgi:hypothetical protein